MNNLFEGKTNCMKLVLSRIRFFFACSSHSEEQSDYLISFTDLKNPQMKLCLILHNIHNVKKSLEV